MTIRLVMVGVFPPPVTGKTKVTASVFDELQAAGFTPRIINLVVQSLDRSLANRLGRAPSVLHGLLIMAGLRNLRGKAFYISISSGWGQFYELAFVTIARLRGMRAFLHHHSFAYLEKPNLLTKALTRVAGPYAVHITQCSRMASILRLEYKAEYVVPVSNVVFQMGAKRTSIRPREQLQTLGFISNITAEKGVFEFLDLMALLESRKLPLSGLLAGPFQDSNTELAVLARLEGLRNVTYVGPVYGPEKDRFFMDIDALIFPSTYLIETEGIVNLEAMSKATPVVAYGRGCIPEIIDADSGKIIDPEKPFVPAAFQQVDEWFSNPAVYRAASQAAARRFCELFAQNEKRWLALMEDLLGRGPSDIVENVVDKEEH